MPSQEQLMEIIRIQTEIAKLGLDLGNVMQFVAEHTLPLVEADGAVIELAEGEDMVYRAAAGSAAGHLGLRLKRASSLSGHCIAQGKILRCDDSEQDDRVDREACRKVGLRSMLVMPLEHDGTVVGVLKAMSARPAKFDENDAILLGLLSEVIAAAMYFVTKLDADTLFYKATHDALTDLANRALFMDRLRNILNPNDRAYRPASVLMIDMDGLKGINDNYGHRAGDAAICELARRIRQVSRDSDTVARLGGDEFGIILSPCEQPRGTESAIKRLRRLIAEPFRFEEQALPFGASIGAANFPDDSHDIERLLELADQRMYAVKREGGLQGTA